MKALIIFMLFRTHNNILIFYIKYQIYLKLGIICYQMQNVIKGSQV